MTLTQQLIMVAAAGAATLLTRFLPFIAFRKHTPHYVRYLGHALPAAVFGLLVIYCLKDVSMFEGSHGIPEAIGILVTGGSYVWRKNMLLSIFSGTICYMLLVNFVFV